MIQQLIERYKRIRTERFLAQTYQYSYAFVGMGQHSLASGPAGRRDGQAAGHQGEVEGVRGVVEQEVYAE